MRLVKYRYSNNEGWDFSEVEFSKINLLVGDTGTGKTRFLNTIFNLGRSVASEEYTLRGGFWDVTVTQNNITYQWTIDVISTKKHKEYLVGEEYVWRFDKEGKKVPLIERDQNKFMFLGKKLPKLSQKKTSINLLQDEEEINPIYKGFASILRRQFSRDALERVLEYQPIPIGLLDRVKNEKDLTEIFHLELRLNATLFFLSQHFPSKYRQICEYYRTIFPFISKIEILDITDLHKNFSVPSKLPVFCIQEKEVDKWIELGQLSSGMQKVLLILTDATILPEGGIYLIDEYENSLGINSINFLPTLLYETDVSGQFIITSHHPYIINNIPIENWLITHRLGGKVNIMYGKELVERFGKSKQQAFIKLVNDPLFSQGVQ